MRPTIVAGGMIALVIAGAGFASYAVREEAAIQGRQAPPQTPPGSQAVPRQNPPARPPASPTQPPTTQPTQPSRGQPPQQTPRQAPPGTPPSGRAVPRPPTPEPPRPGSPGGRFPITPSYPSYPWSWYQYQYFYLYPYRYFPSPRWYWPVTLTGRLRLDIDQKDASVYVDGYYAGIVDDFDGFFQHLTLSAGPHTIEIRKPGFQPLALEVDIPIDQTVTYRDRMVVARPGEPDAVPARAASADTSEAAASALQATPGDIRLDVTPKDAKVYVDGYYVGIVDDFDGRLQRLTVAPGPHHVVIQADGYDQLEVDLYVQPRQTLTYRGALKRSAE